MTGRSLPPTSAFAGDDGSGDPQLMAVLARHAVGELDVSDVVRVLAGTRVLVPVLAALERSETVVHASRAHTVDKEASAGIVAIQAPDGRTALPVFSSVAQMAAWHPDARPVPADVDRAALSAVDEGWELLVLDAGGPHPVVVPRPAVWALAQRQSWRPAVAGQQVDVEVDDAIRTALVAVPEVTGVLTEPGRRAEVAVALTLADGLGRAALDDVLLRVGAALAADDTVTRRVDSLELRLRTG